LIVRIEATNIDGLLLLTPTRLGDERGWFMETYRADVLAEAGIGVTFVQDNQALSAQAGTIRGLHFQRAPHAQGKLIRCTRGAILDVAVDLRPGSTTFGDHQVMELSAENARCLFVPAGFAHGYCTLTDNSEVQYKVTDYYAPDCEGGLFWRDDALGIAWPVTVDEAIVSERDRTWPRLEELKRTLAEGGSI
jgi:dTDP-4-dehydrorhamnose 3,5-epimerase